MQNDIEQRLVNLDPPVVGDKPHFAEAIHEEADSGARSANHLCQSFLCDLRDQRFRFTWLAEFGHQQKDAGKALFAGVEQLVDKIGLGSHTASEQELQK